MIYSKKQQKQQKKYIKCRIYIYSYNLLLYSNILLINYNVITL